MKKLGFAIGAEAGGGDRVPAERSEAIMLSCGPDEAEVIRVAYRGFVRAISAADRCAAAWIGVYVTERSLCALLQGGHSRLLWQMR